MEQAFLDAIGTRLNELSKYFYADTYVIPNWTQQNVQSMKMFVAQVYDLKLQDFLQTSVLNLLMLRHYRLHPDRVYLPKLLHHSMLEAIAEQAKSPTPYREAEKFLWNYRPVAMRTGAPMNEPYYFGKYGYKEIFNYPHDTTNNTAAEWSLRQFQKGIAKPSGVMLQVVDKHMFCLLGLNYMMESQNNVDERLMTPYQDIREWLEFHSFLRDALARVEAQTIPEMFGFIKSTAKIGKATFSLPELHSIHRAIIDSNHAVVEAVMARVRPTYVKNSIDILAQRVSDAITLLHSQVSEEDMRCLFPILLNTENQILKGNEGGQDNDTGSD